MNPLILKETEDTPEIKMEGSTGKIEIKGRSYPENASEFYTPVKEWLESYKNAPNDKTEVDFKMTYFNTSSSRSLMEILNIFKDIEKSGKEVKINWYYYTDDPDMHDAGRGYAELLDFPIELIALEEEID